MNQRLKVVISCLALIAVAVLLVACGGNETTEAVAEEATEAVAEVAAEAVEPMTLDAETQGKVTAVLAVLDAADGTTDMKVSKCMCGMTVDNDDHASHIEGYDVRFCSVDCKDMFDKDAAASVLGMATPAP
jgi:YHS domain-containing protein